MSKNKQAILTVAPSASGKSSWTNQFIRNRDSWYNLERDQIRFQLFTKGKRDWNLYKFTKKNEETVTKEYNERLEQAISLDYNLVLSDTWLNDKYRNTMISKLESAGYEVTIKDDWNIDWETLRRRNIQREGGISESVLWSQYKRFWKYKGNYIYEPDLNLPECVVFDIDGSLAIKSEDRGYFEWDKVGEDTLREDVYFMYRGHDLHYHIVVASGRDSICREETSDWLERSGIEYEELHMREQGSYDKDYKVKLEMLQDISTRYNIVAWVDDRPQVSEFLRLVGVNVIQVSDPLVRF